ncbi:hypothetical protein SAY87_017082 [Trapa incisa]|uniref:Protein FLUORESCENT IN BLUE LIGHT, chloroplastic-like n=1 Tax=Trapa incisa TaxID=236973 RepID=A0AAN7QY36_9MYRT|nr:hypothetical protein SAY87_017082 [Trapa incisa]
MEIVLQSSGVFYRKNPPLSGCFSSAARPPDNATKFTSSSGDASSGSPQIQHFLLVGKAKFLLHHYGTVLRQLSAHQEKLDFRCSGKVLIAYNALILAAPFQALAETCEAEGSALNMRLLLLVALIGATVGGLLARQRKGDLQKVNEQLRQINAALRKQAKMETYSPALSNATVGSRFVENEVIVDLKREEMIARLKAGKSFLRNQDPEGAFGEFKAGLELAKQLKDPVEEKKAVRGLGACLHRQGKYAEAIKYLKMVLQISKREGEDSGNTEAYGAIADCYTELGDLERAVASSICSLRQALEHIQATTSKELSSH